MKRVRVTADAENDLDEIWLYVSKHGNEDTANRLIDDLTGRLALLGSAPGNGSRP
jgi:plasmid stabilization system protein ParE